LPDQPSTKVIQLVEALLKILREEWYAEDHAVDYTTKRIVVKCGGCGDTCRPEAHAAYAMLWQMPVELRLGDAARAIGVSVDTLRRWDRAGKLQTTRDERNQRRVPRSEVERLTARQPRHPAGDGLSARNRFSGVVRSVEVDGVMALVELEAGPHRITAAITRDAVDELGLTEGVRATAAVKATSVMIERDDG